LFFYAQIIDANETGRMYFKQKRDPITFRAVKRAGHALFLLQKKMAVMTAELKGS
jgi:hypothetical protein